MVKQWENDEKLSKMTHLATQKWYVSRHLYVQDIWRPLMLTYQMVGGRLVYLPFLYSYMFYRSICPGVAKCWLSLHYNVLDFIYIRKPAVGEKLMKIGQIQCFDQDFLFASTADLSMPIKSGRLQFIAWLITFGNQER